MTGERESDCADVTCDGRLFQKLAPETGTARLPTVKKLNGRTASCLEEAEDGTSVTRVKYDDRYDGALPFRAVFCSRSGFVKDE